MKPVSLKTALSRQLFYFASRMTDEGGFAVDCCPVYHVDFIDLPRQLKRLRTFNTVKKLRAITDTVDEPVLFGDFRLNTVVFERPECVEMFESKRSNP